MIRLINVFSGILIWVFCTMNAPANYFFLGQLQNYQQTESGAILYCEDDIRLEIRFLKPEMFRVTLVRPGYQEPLLDYPIAKTAWEPVDLEFRETDLHLILASREIDLIIHKMPCRLTVLDKQGEVINQDDPGMGIGWDGREVRCWKTLAGDERFFGLGEKTGDVNKRGRQWVMWNDDIPGYDHNTDPIYQSIPFYIGLHNNKAYGIYFNNSYRTVFNFGAGNRRYASFAADAGPLDYFFIYGPRVSRVVSTYTELTGRIHLPPLWGLGYQQCRWSYYPASEVMNLARTFREKQIPADVIYLDIHYMDGYRVFTWDKKRFPDPAGMLQQLQQMGFKVVTIIDPGVKADSNYSVTREGIAGEHFVKYPDDEIYIGEVWPGPSFFPDFSRPETRRWWGQELAGMLDTGIDGFWNDMNEPAVWGRAFPLEVLMDDKGRTSSQKKMHNLYGFLMSQAAFESFRTHRPNQRPFLVTRAGFAGEQRFTAVWTGDNVASEDHLELGIRMMLGLGLSGIPFVGTDVGGFIGTPSPELFARWIQVGAFSPFFRTHTHHNSRDQEPWSFGEELEEISRKFVSLRYQLLPYLYNLFWEASESGTPILRPMFWYYQDDPVVYDHAYQHQFFVGEKLLVAPVTREKQYLKKVYLPAGKWLELNTEKVYQGAGTVVVEAPLDRIPMFLRDGGILPRQEAMQYVGEKASDVLMLDIFCADNYGNLLHYEDDGETFNHKRGEYRLTQFEFLQEKDHWTFSKNRVQDKLLAAERFLELRLYRFEKIPEKIQLEGRTLKSFVPAEKRREGYFYDNQKKILTIRFPDSGNTQMLKIK
jgi:alpha-glucosidase